MKTAIFGLTISSTWGNGHATLWRGLIRSLSRRGWHCTFFERNVPYYAQSRDLYEIEGGDLVLYDSWPDVEARAKRDLRAADVAIVTSYCPDAILAGELIASTQPRQSVFYDLDTPVTLAELNRGKRPSYVGPQGLQQYDLVLSFTGGAALSRLCAELGARKAFALYGHADPVVHRPAAPKQPFASGLSYLGTYSADRQPMLISLFLEPARRRPDLRFVIGGAQYPPEFPWEPNVFFVRHLPPCEHAAFFCSSRLTLNVTRHAMADMGWCPSGRLFEAAACGVPVISDLWAGLEDFFEPGRELLVARGPEEVLSTLGLPAQELERIGRRARERVLSQHTSDHRAAELERILSSAAHTAQRVA